MPMADDEAQAVLRRWQDAQAGMDGQRAAVPQPPDDAVAYRLLEAAEAAFGRGDRGKGVNILRLVVKDYRESQEAAFARRVMDRLGERGGRVGR